MDLLPQVFAELKDGRIPQMELLTLVATRARLSPNYSAAMALTTPSAP